MMKLTSYKNTLPNKIYFYFWPLDGAIYCTKECRPLSFLFFNACSNDEINFIQNHFNK